MGRTNTLNALLFVGVIAATGLTAAISARSFKLTADAAIVDGSFTKAFESHYEEHFPAKQLGVNLWAAIDYALFREGRAGVVVGKEGWLYTDEEFNVEENGAATVRENLAQIAQVRTRLASEGISLIAAVVPAKARIYSEFVGERQPANVHRSLYDVALAGLAAEHIPTVDLRGALAAGKARQKTYFRTDTHWTPWGAQLAATEIANAMRTASLAPEQNESYVTRVERSAVHRGDLCNFLPLDPYFTQLLPPRETLDVMKTEAARPAVASKTSATAAQALFGDSELPDIALVGTSYSANALWNFTGYLKEALHADIANYAREGAGPYLPMHAYLQSADFHEHRPHLVIWEIPERALLMSRRTAATAETP